MGGLAVTDKEHRFLSPGDLRAALDKEVARLQRAFRVPAPAVGRPPRLRTSWPLLPTEALSKPARPPGPLRRTPSWERSYDELVTPTQEIRQGVVHRAVPDNLPDLDDRFVTNYPTEASELLRLRKHVRLLSDALAAAEARASVPPKDPREPDWGFD